MFQIKSFKALILAGLFASLTAVGAFIKVPLPTVPITLQTFFVYLSANILGAYYGTMSQIFYLTIGLIGIPVFAYGGGLAYFIHPTFGFLLAYPICVFIVGKILHIFFLKREGNLQGRALFINIFIADFIGLMIIFLLGAVYLYFNLRWGLYLKLGNAALPTAIINWDIMVKLIAFVFIPADLIKIFLASFVTTKILKRYNR